MSAATLPPASSNSISAPAHRPSSSSGKDDLHQSPKVSQTDKAKDAPSSPVAGQPPNSSASATPTPSSKDQGPDEGKDETSTSMEDVIDMDTFKQILDLDEDDDHEFSLEMVEAYYSQAAQTFVDMDEALKGKDLEKLSDLGHFLKGSSAALGVSKVRISCEKIQNYGSLRDDEAKEPIPADDALARITKLMSQVKDEYKVAEAWLKKYYGKESDD